MTELRKVTKMAPYYEVSQPALKMVVRNLNFYYGSIQALSSSFLIMADMDLSCSTKVHTQQPKRLSPQLGVEVSITSGHSASGEAPW